MQAMGEGHGNGSTAIPFILAAGMEINVGLAAHNCHGFGARTAHRDQFSTNGVGNRNGLGGGAGATDDHTRTTWHSGGRHWLISAEDEAQSRQRYGTSGGDAIYGQGNMHGPIRSPLPKFASAIQRIDYPHPRLGEARLIIGFFFGEQAVSRAFAANGLTQIRISFLVALLAQGFATEPFVSLHYQESASRFGGQHRRELGISHTHFSGIN
jgi:hypothetical protein